MKKFNEFKLNEEDEYDYDTEEELEEFVENVEKWFYDHEDSIDEFDIKIRELAEIINDYNEWLEDPKHANFEASMTIGNMTGLTALSNIEPEDLRKLGEILDKIQNR